MPVHAVANVEYPDFADRLYRPLGHLLQDPVAAQVAQHCGDHQGEESYEEKSHKDAQSQSAGQGTSRPAGPIPFTTWGTCQERL